MWSIENLSNELVLLARNNTFMLLPVISALAFAESIILFSLFIPASVILIGFGALVAAADINPIPVLLAATLGAALGEWISYAAGYVLKERVSAIWPISRRPDLLERGVGLIAAWGILGVFAAKFIGPLRGVVPLLAGSLRMPQKSFQIANWTSSLLWATVWLSPGYIAAKFWP